MFFFFKMLFFQMTAEFQVPSPHVPTRENHFVRYCKLHPDGIWVVADVSLHLLNETSASSSSTASRTKRRPSGCLIETLPNGLTKVLNTFSFHLHQK